eukprot:2447276-Alexandrium_andersonii.AAC.1
MARPCPCPPGGCRWPPATARPPCRPLRSAPGSLAGIWSLLWPSGPSEVGRPAGHGALAAAAPPGPGGAA